MRYGFAGHTLDEARRELRRGGDPVAVEPQVFDLLLHLLANRDRVVTKDELIDAVWGGRIVSESTLTSRINAARTAVGDSGAHQRIIRTIPRKGFRFVAEVADGASTAPAAPVLAASSSEPPPPPTPARRASVLILPFADLGADGVGAALASDVITRLAKLRSLFVIAEGTASVLHARGVAPGEAGRMLEVDYVASGSVRRLEHRVTVQVELAETRTARIIWTEQYMRPAADLLSVLHEVGDSIVSAIASEIETLDRNRALLTPPTSLDAWGAYHRGLSHMYRFSREENAQARGFFEQAAGLDPTFSRAHAGLSFTHWQDAFQDWEARDASLEAAYAAAGLSLMADDRDPAAHLAMGRALWLRGDRDTGLAEMEQAVELSPSYAFAHFNIASSNATHGDPLLSLAATERSIALSPYDPMLFAMMTNNALALTRLGRYEEAAGWAVKAAARPNAHALVLAVAACCLALIGDREQGRLYAARARQLMPNIDEPAGTPSLRVGPECDALFRHAAAQLE